MGADSPPPHSHVPPWFLKSVGRRYYSPVFQITLIGLVCFCCPGMFVALNGMGGGGQLNPSAANNANTALYATFAVFGLLGGGIYNILGPHVTLLFGCSFYVLYVGSFLYYNHHTEQTFVIVAGALLGLGAGLLWAGQGAMMTAYPTEDRKGMYISLFWTVFNLGGVVGGFIPFALNYHSSFARVNDGTYIAFMIIMSIGALLTLALASPHKVIRDDGSRVTLVRYSKVSLEMWEILKLFADWKMLLLVPACWASNYFYTYQFNNVNDALFTVRTRGLNNVFYWGAQMAGSISVGYLLDHCSTSRRRRGYVGVILLAILSTAIWGGGLANQLRYSRNKPLAKIDFKDSGSKYSGPFVLYFFYGLLDAMYQTLCYWIIGALTDNSQTLSRYSGFYKGVQSAGAAVAWQVDEHNVSFLSEIIANWGLMTLSFPLLLVLISLAVKDITPGQEQHERDFQKEAPGNAEGKDEADVKDKSGPVEETSAP
eukprot:c28698_g1_i3 orf=159-1610(+)